MDITNITANTAQPQNQKETAPFGNSKLLGKHAFLKLLVTQMKNQNPINPMDGTKLASQLAQFNTVGQLINLNKGMGKLVRGQYNMISSISNTMAASLAGKRVKAISNRIQIKAGEDCTIPYQLSGPADDVKITITDSNGTTVRTVKLEHVSGGNHTWTWNGQTNNGKDVPEGIYEVHIEAQNGDDKVGVLVYQKGIAEKVRYTPEGVRLIINGVAVSLGNVKEIGIGNSQS